YTSYENMFNLFDGDLATPAWFKNRQLEGYYVTYDLGQDITLEHLEVFVTESEHDFPRHAVLEASADGEEWHTVMTFGNQDGPNEGEAADEDRIEAIFPKHEESYRSKEVSGLDQEARYLRFKITRDKVGSDKWVRMQEIVINHGKYYPEINDPTITTTSDINIGNGVHKIADGNISTKYKSANERAGEVLYHIGEAGTSVTGITLMEDPSNVSNSKVSVRTLNGWKELGTTQSGYTFFDVADMDSVLDVKIEWTDGNAPALYEVQINKVEDNGNVESTIKVMKTLVDQYTEEGKIEKDRDARLLQTHLTSLDHYVKKDSLGKAD